MTGSCYMAPVDKAGNCGRAAAAYLTVSSPTGSGVVSVCRPCLNEWLDAADEGDVDEPTTLRWLVPA